MCPMTCVGVKGVWVGVVSDWSSVWHIPTQYTCRIGIEKSHLIYRCAQYVIFNVTRVPTSTEAKTASTTQYTFVLTTPNLILPFIDFTRDKSFKLVRFGTCRIESSSMNTSARIDSGTIDAMRMCDRGGAERSLSAEDSDDKGEERRRVDAGTAAARLRAARLRARNSSAHTSIQGARCGSQTYYVSG